MKQPVRACALAFVLFFLPTSTPLVAAQDTLYQGEETWLIPTFSLTDQKGQAFSSANLQGKVWVAHFFFTTCTGGCTKTAPAMAELQKLVRGKRGIALVSISLNQDAPEDLQQYARGLEADPEQWIFLTGEKAKVHDIVQNFFKEGVQEVDNAPPGQEIIHSFHLMVIDGNGKMCGYVDGREMDAAQRLYQRLRSLDRNRFLLPAFNAVLNLQCAVLLILGYLAIRQRRETLHKVCMVAALVVSMIFLSSYLYYHLVILGGQPTRFQGSGPVRILYFAILLSHTVLAALVAPLALYITYQGFRDHRIRHVRVARWTLPVWLYVSITGVVVYLMLYHLYPPS